MERREENSTVQADSIMEAMAGNCEQSVDFSHIYRGTLGTLQHYSAFGG